MKRIQVAVGVIQKGDKVLIGQRCVQDQYFQKWEFPGGKLEQGESALSALKRELSEELGIEVLQALSLIRIDHDYPDRQVALHVFWVGDFLGEPKGAEGQAIKWISPEHCYKEDFLAANEPIVNAVSLPTQIYITDIQQFGLEHTLKVISAAVKRCTDDDSRENQFAIQLREKNATEIQLQEYLKQIRKVANDQLIFLNSDYGTALKLGFDGVHLSSARSKEHIQYKIDQLENNVASRDCERFWVGVSCHNQEEIEQAANIADFVFLSAVKQTNSHPGKQAMGWAEFSHLAAQAKQPIYALGGVSAQDIPKAQKHGAQGIAAISSIWGLGL